MASPQRPRRQRKGDRFAAPGAQANEIQCDYALAPFDRRAREIEQLWGIDRLPSLVSESLAAKYGAAIAHLNECIAEEDPAKVAAAAANCIKGMDAMEAEAKANGHQPATGEAWEYELTDGEEVFRFAVIKDEAEWPALKARRPDLMVFTMHEVAVALRGMSRAIALEDIKRHFPGAKITNTPKLPASFWEQGGDEINFKGGH